MILSFQKTDLLKNLCLPNLSPMELMLTMQGFIVICATSCEVVIYDSIWCLLVPPLSTLLPAAVDTVFILFIWQTTAVGNEATSNTSLDRPRSG